MLGIKNYTPKYINNSEALFHEHSERLRELIGERIERVLSVYDIDTDEIWGDCPIVILINGQQLEICVWQTNEISMTWNEINIEEPLDWYGCDDVNLEWRTNETLEGKAMVDQCINDIEIIDYLFESRNVDGSNIRSEWELNGIGFSLANEYVSIFNKLDEYDLCIGKSDEKLRYFSILKSY